MPRYKTYYGRKKARWLKMLILSLLAGGFVALCVFILPNYVTYSEDGLTFDLPFLRWGARNPAPSPEPPPTYNDVIIDVPFTPSPPLPPSPSASAPPPSPSPPPVTERIQALEYKGISGAVIDGAALKEALEGLARPGLTLTAVISACVDNAVPFGPNAAWAVKHQSGVNFKDTHDRRWLNLYLPEVRGFIVEQVLGAYEAGFDRVLLTHVGFPYSSGASQADYNGLDVTVGHMAAVNMLLQELRDAVGTRPLDVLLFEEEVVVETAGQELAAFTETFDLIFTTLSDDGILETENIMGESYELPPWN